MIFSERLRLLIEEKELTQKQLARELKIPVSTLGGYVQGTSEPDFNTLKIIASYFDVSSDYLLGLPVRGTSNESEQELLRVFQAMTPEERGIYIDQGKAFIRAKKRKYN